MSSGNSWSGVMATPKILLGRDIGELLPSESQWMGLKYMIIYKDTILHTNLSPVQCTVTTLRASIRLRTFQDSLRLGLSRNYAHFWSFWCTHDRPWTSADRGQCGC